jgi:dynein heavy chain
MTYIMMNCLKILQISGKLKQDDIDILLKSGAGLDIKSEKPNPYIKFMSNDVWMNVVQLSRHPFGKDNLCIFRDLQESIGRAP